MIFILETASQKVIEMCMEVIKIGTSYTGK